MNSKNDSQEFATLLKEYGRLERCVLRITSYLTKLNILLETGKDNQCTFSLNDIPSHTYGELRGLEIRIRDVISKGCRGKFKVKETKPNNGIIIQSAKDFLEKEGYIVIKKKSI